MKALVLFSGGIDSTTALGLAIKKYGKDQVIALSVSYGQKHDKEIRAAIAVAEYYGETAKNITNRAIKKLISIWGIGIL